MAKIQFASFIRRINRRLSALAKRFGKSSSLYQQYASEIDARIPSGNIRYNAKGVIQIAKPKNLESKGFSQYLINQRVNIPTPTEVVNKYKAQYTQYASEVKTPMSIDEFVQTMNNVLDTFNKYFDSDQIRQVLFEKHEEKPLDEDIFNKGLDALNNFMNQRNTDADIVTYEDFVDLARVIDAYGL